ncbi:hypothetical protein [Sedimenticola hydrogenitrophicus]|uniref:hypothetical protein n=1 Tax=Sedimenticola hydrogenitrophicus TaxID=2967975 RepID=UPI0021A2CD1D|nr:hypothetical protein [Sedimenticola hydrogenitrophicus]
MSIHDKISVNTYYTRSINLERDAESSSVVGAYIPTTRAIRTLDSMAVALKSMESPRAWSLVGPYGSGKSSFAVFLAHLLSDPSEDATELALKKLGKSDRGLGLKFRNLTRDSAGYGTVLLTGSPESLSRRLVRALAEKASQLLHGRCKIIQELADLAQRDEQPTTSEIISSIRALQDALASKYSGLLIVIDELGKFLEYEARHYGANDIFLLQALAEHALADHSVKLSLVVMLHQAFERYARGLGESLKNEWAKVQGRFENIPFLESAEQTLRIVGAALTHDFTPDESNKVNRVARKMANVLHKAKAIPGTMDEVTAADLFTQCYPLHPVSALLLPILCQKVAQNERTLFSYLGSREVHGFQDGLSRCVEASDWIYPWEIYEYFILNQSAALTDHFTHRRWAEVVTAVERIGDASTEEVQLLKTIGLLNIVGAQGGFKASNEVIELCLPNGGQIQSVISRLKKKAVLQYRKFSSEFRVWQGSDFDIDAAVEEERAKLKNLKLAQTLNARHSIAPIVARKYSIKTGALRYFLPIFVDRDSYRTIEAKSADARIIFFLAEEKNDDEFFHAFVRTNYSTRDITVLSFNGEQLRESVSEVIALERVQHNAQELNSDPVAQREFNDRYNNAVQREEELLGRLTDEPEISRWFSADHEYMVSSKRGLQEVLSTVLETVYSDSPRIYNELINRDKPSAQANAAKNKLVLAMFNNEQMTDLGIEKFPPEKAIYRAALRETRLHVKGRDGEWRFQAPTKANDPCNILPVWRRIEKFLDSTEQRPKTFVELNGELMEPPYGIKEGMLPILYIASLMANKQDLAIFEDKIYTPYFSEEQVERFLKKPDDFTVQRFHITGVNFSIYEAYSNTLYNDGKQRSILELARPIAQMVLNLPQYTQTTNDTTRLSLRAQKVRNIFKLSKSPMDLMMTELPQALGVDLVKAKNNTNEVAKLSRNLTDTLRDLKYCLPNLKDEFRALLAQAFMLDKEIDLDDLKDVVAGRCRGLEDYTIDRDGLKAFILRTLKSTKVAEAWLCEILNFLGQKPVEKWNDADRDAAEYRLTLFSRKLSELEKLRIHYKSVADNFDTDFDVYLLRSVKKGAPDYDEVIVVDKSRHDAIKSIKDQIASVFKGTDEALKMAALAEIVDEVLVEKNKSANKSKASKQSVELIRAK